MKRISIRELHEATGRLVREAAEGGYVVTDRGRPVAQIVPLGERQHLTPFAERVLRPGLAKMKMIRGDSTDDVREERDRR